MVLLKKEDADKHFDKVKLCDRHYHLLHITKWNKIQPGSINFIFVLYLIKLTAKNLSCDSPLTIRFYYHPPCTVTLNFQAMVIPLLDVGNFFSFTVKRHWIFSTTPKYLAHWPQVHWSQLVIIPHLYKNCRLFWEVEHC